jgi:hypothetical protein
VTLLHRRRSSSPMHLRWFPGAKTSTIRFSTSSRNSDALTLVLVRC